jgi:homoserine O-acetyltransferase
VSFVVKDFLASSFYNLRAMKRLALLLLLSLSAYAANFPTPKDGTYIAHNFKFKSGETLPEVKIHYYTFGTPQKDASGRTTNAVLILHGTSGSGRQFLIDGFAGVLFNPGQLLDATKYFIVIPDNVGHGQSSKPSDGLHMHFPKYEYDDMIELQYRLLSEGLGVNHMRLVMGTSMGGMHSWLWGEQHPGFMDALMPLASAPVEIAGRNRMMRRMFMDSITNDPNWKNGEYTEQPKEGLSDGFHMFFMMSSAPVYDQVLAPTREQADAYIEKWIADRTKTVDANDLLYAFDASRHYNPDPALEKITAPLTAINSADDTINPPELGILEREIKRVPKGKFVLLPITPETRGHGTHTIPKIWQQHLKDLLERSQTSKQ